MGLGLVFTQEPTCNISYSDFRYELSNFSLKYTFSGVLVWVQDQVHGLGHRDWAWSLSKSLHTKFHIASFSTSLEMSV